MEGEPNYLELGMEEVDLTNYLTATSCSDVMGETLADNGKIVESCEAEGSSHSD